MTKEAYAHKALQWAKGEIISKDPKTTVLTFTFSSQTLGPQPNPHSLRSRWYRNLGLLHSQALPAASPLGTFNQRSSINRHAQYPPLHLLK